MITLYTKIVRAYYKKIFKSQIKNSGHNDFFFFVIEIGKENKRINPS